LNSDPTTQNSQLLGQKLNFSKITANSWSFENNIFNFWVELLDIKVEFLNPKKIDF
jgi:hypothetical protein